MTNYLIVSSLILAAFCLHSVVAILTSKRANFRQTMGINSAPLGMFATFFVWLLGYSVWQMSKDELYAIAGIRILILGSCFIPPALLSILYHVTRQKRPRLVYASLAFSSILALLGISTDLICSNLIDFPQFGLKHWPLAGHLFPLYCLYIIFACLYTSFGFYQAYRKASDSERKILLPFMLGTSLGSLGGLTEFPLWVEIKIPPLGHFSSGLFLVYSGYAVFRFRLVQYNKLLTRFLGILTAAFLLGAIFSDILLRLLHSTSYTKIDSFMFWWPLLSLMVGSILFAGPYFSDFLWDMVFGHQRMKNRLHRKEIGALTNRILAIEETHIQLHELANGLKALFNLQQCTIYLRDNIGDSFQLQAQAGSVDNELAVPSHSLESLLLPLNGPVLVEEAMEMSIAFRDRYYSFKATHNNIQESDTIIPIVAVNDLRGILILRQDGAHKPISDSDLLVLENLCNNIGLQDRAYEIERRANRVEKLTAVGTIASGLAHELNNPLTSVKTLLTLLDRKNSIPISDDFVLRAKTDLARVISIVNDVAAFAKDRSVIFNKVNIASVLREAMSYSAKEAQLNNISITIESDGDSISVMGDNGQLVQVFSNLCSNAVQAISEWEGRPEHGMIEFKVRVKGGTILRTERRIEISVTDNGPGITQEKSDIIFEPFYTTRANLSGKRTKTGTGLGLALVKNMVERHYGTISVKSELGAGCSFLVTLKPFEEK